MSLHRKNRILEVSIESDSFYKPDIFVNATRESKPDSIIVHNIQHPEWAVRALRNIRNVKNVVDIGEAPIDETSSLHAIKVIYDSDRLDASKPEQLIALKQLVRNAIASSGVSHQSHL